MTKHAKDRAEQVRSSGLVNVKKSGAVSVDWNKALRSDIFKKDAEKMSQINKSERDAETK